MKAYTYVPSKKHVKYVGPTLVLQTMAWLTGQQYMQNIFMSETVRINANLAKHK